jgi:hypothetical protein
VAYATDDRVWFEVLNSLGRPSWGAARLVSFEGSALTPIEDRRVNWSNLNGSVVGQLQPSVWTLEWPASSSGAGSGCEAARVVSIDLDTGESHVLRDLPGPTIDEYYSCSGLDDGQAMSTGNHFFVLTGQATDDDSTNGYGRVYALVTPTATR